jgi:hypothetical protein
MCGRYGARVNLALDGPSSPSVGVATPEVAESGFTRQRVASAGLVALISGVSGPAAREPVARAVQTTSPWRMVFSVTTWGSTK